MWGQIVSVIPQLSNSQLMLQPLPTIDSSRRSTPRPSTRLPDGGSPRSAGPIPPPRRPARNLGLMDGWIVGFVGCWIDGLLDGWIDAAASGHTPNTATSLLQTSTRTIADGTLP